MSRPPLASAPFDAARAKEAQVAWANYLGRAVEEEVGLGGGVKLTVVLIPPGTFRMGAPDGERDAYAKERPPHTVTINTPFYLGKYEVSQAQYKVVAGENPSRFRSSPDGDTDLLPVESVTWEEAQRFCEKLTVRHRERGGTGRFGLPTEAEWEYACRSGTTTPFYFGQEANGRQANCDGSHPYGTGRGGPFIQRTCRVGQYAANAWGLYDMHGNVWEWCADDWTPDHVGASSDGTARTVPGAKERVMRGGAWNNHAGHCRAAYRADYSPLTRDASVGFRVCCHLD